MIKQIDRKDLKQLEPLAKKEGLIFCKNTKYIGYFKENELVGFSGYLEYKNKTVFKNHFVLPEYRRQGIFSEMFTYLFDKTKVPIEATCTKMSINHYLKKGFRIFNSYKNGCKKVRYENI